MLRTLKTSWRAHSISRDTNIGVFPCGGRDAESAENLARSARGEWAGTALALGRRMPEPQAPAVPIQPDQYEPARVDVDLVPVVDVVELMQTLRLDAAAMLEARAVWP
jgi:hypothetical protein